MVIAKVMGGFGNQLGIYARGYSLARYLNQELVLDVSDYTQRGYFRPYALDKLKIGNHRKLIYPPFPGDFTEIMNDIRLITDESAGTREKLLQASAGARNVYLSGYGGRKYCTSDDLAELHAQYRLKDPSPAVEMFQAQIAKEYSVAVHIRRTDFVSLNAEDSQKYFFAAISYIRLSHPEAQFYFFSDDIAYAKETFGNCADYHYVQLLGGMDTDLEEFFCISSCNARILSTKSTFSSWASALSRSEDKLDITQGDESELTISEKKVCLTSAVIEALSAQYQPVAVAKKSEPKYAVEEEAYRLVTAGQNRKSVAVIDKACMDSYMLSGQDLQILTDLKAIALAQDGERSSAAAIRVFYQQMQTQADDPAFHANFFLTLYHAGHILESAIHAALANRYGDPEDYTEYFIREKHSDPVPLEMYLLLKNSRIRHFVFVPVEGWNYYIGYVKTIAALLAQMGQKVSFFSGGQDICIPKGLYADNKDIADAAFKHGVEADHTYRFHLKLLPVISRIYEDRKQSLFDEELQQCISRSEMPVTVVVSNPVIFSVPKSMNAKYVVPDICDPLNTEKYTAGINDVDAYVSAMLDYADDVFLSGDLFEKFKALNPEKIHKAFSAWDNGTHTFLDTELDFTANYISSENMIRNAFEILKLTADFPVDG